MAVICCRSIVVDLDSLRPMVAGRIGALLIHLGFVVRQFADSARALLSQFGLAVVDDQFDLNVRNGERERLE